MSLSKYPSVIRCPMLSGNSRTQSARFFMSEPQNGPPYIKKLPDNQPAFFNFTFTFVDDEIPIFYMWFTETLEKGTKAFLMDILTEFGLVEYECRFLPDNLLDTTVLTKRVFSYSAKIMVSKFNPPDYVPPGIGEVPELFLQRNLLDIIVNIELPENS